MGTQFDIPAAMRRELPAMLLVLAGTLPALAQGAAVAMVTDLQGKAAVTSDGRSRDVTILTALESGAQVRLDAGASLVALYLDAGSEYAFKGPSLITFRRERPELVIGAGAEVRSAWPGPAGKSIRIDPAGVAQGALVMRGSSQSSARIRLLTLRTTRTLETRPEFRWQELQPGLQYRFEINDGAGRTLHEALLDVTSYKLPSSVQLKDGVPYTWEVSARLADGRKYTSAGDFSVAPADLRAQAEALRPAASAPLSRRVTYAAWLAQMVLKDEARKYWKTASSERPEDARLRALAAQ